MLLNRYRSILTKVKGEVKFSLAKGISSQIRSNMAKLLEKEDALRLISSIDNFLFDCDGVLWDGSGPMEKSRETILKLKELGKRVYYVTNNSSKSRKDYVDKCREWGFPAEEDDIVCTAYMAAQFLKMKGFQGKVYVMGKEEGLGKELKDAGIPYTGPGPDPITSTDSTDHIKTELDPEVNCVIVGFDPHISFMKILKASSYLKNPDCLFIGTNEDPCLPVNSKIRLPGAGSMVAPVKVASQRAPIIVGKPELGMFDVLRDLHQLDPSRSMMTGDRLETDIVFAQKSGMKSFLVLSGQSTHEEMVMAKEAGITPDFYADCLGVLGNSLQ